jgi:hypothetical protein
MHLYVTATTASEKQDVITQWSRTNGESSITRTVIDTTQVHHLMTDILQMSDARHLFQRHEEVYVRIILASLLQTLVHGGMYGRHLRVNFGGTFLQLHAKGLEQHAVIPRFTDVRDLPRAIQLVHDLVGHFGTMHGLDTSTHRLLLDTQATLSRF